MENFTDKLVVDYEHSDLYKQLVALNEAFKNTTKQINGEIFILHSLEAQYFDLLYRNRVELLSEECLPITKEINDLVYYVLTHVIAGGESGLEVGQTTYNASVTEYGMHKNYGWSYGGKGDLDHLYHHTGTGFSGTDFELTDAFEFTTYDKILAKPSQFIISAGSKVDAKDFMTRETMDTKLAKNINGSFGHFGDFLFIHIISDNSYYITKNIAGAEVIPIFGISSKTAEYHQVKLSVDTNGFLAIDKYYN